MSGQEVERVFSGNPAFYKWTYDNDGNLVDRTVDELKRLDPNDEILIVRTLKPIRAKKAWYFRYHPMRDVAKQYEIHDISEMPKTDDVPVRVMDVRKHLQEREERAKQIMSQRKIEIEPMQNGPVINSLPNQNLGNSKPASQSHQSVNESFDLQKELEKKFDELFGTDN